MRAWAAVAVAVLSACTPGGGPATSTVTDTLSLAACPVEGTAALLCAVGESIDESYVDPVDHAALAAAALAGLDDVEPRAAASPFVCAAPWPELVDVCREIDRRRLDPAEAVPAAVSSLVHTGLDPYSVYIDPVSLALLDEESSGTVEGIGALVTTEDTAAPDPRAAVCPVVSDTCRLVIVSVIAGGPAEAAGIRAGDAVVAVDGEPAAGQALEIVTGKVRGPAGTTVRLGLLRDGERIEVAVERAAVQVPILLSATVGATAYLRLAAFTGDSADRVGGALTELVAAGPELLVLDLRDNPGGSLDAAVSIAGEMLDGGVVVRTAGPGGRKEYEDEPGGAALDVPVVVLVNRGSASASEVVAGALADHGRALVVGERTFGKDTVQQQFSLPDGGALRLTIGRWSTPDGHDFGGTGITPDIELALPGDLTPEEVVAAVRPALSRSSGP